MKVIGSILNNVGFILLLVFIVLLGAQYVLGSGADGVAVAGREIGSGAVNNFFNPFFASEHPVVSWVAGNLIPCAVGSFCVMILGSILHRAGNK